ncbi:MAG: NUDIX hydrolase [Acidobacteria bacterium]|nr:NUDIX hydrolase [Acidobacteriota bacterium]
MPKTRSSSNNRGELIFQGRVFSVRRHSVVEPGGVRVRREIVHHNGSAVMLPRFADGRVLLIRQFRFAAGSALWELPAGTIDPGETPLQTARRELEEETGYHAKSWRKLLVFYPSPGLLTEKMTLFLASDIRPGTAKPEDDEQIEVRPYSMAKALALIERGKIRDAKTIVGLLYLARSTQQRLKTGHRGK